MLNTTAQPTIQPEFDLKQTIGIGKLRGFWKLMTGFRGKYFVSTMSMGIAAIMNTATFLLLRHFVDHYMVEGDRSLHLAVYVAGFLGLAVIQAGSTFNSRRLAAKTAEGIAKRIRPTSSIMNPEIILSMQSSSSISDKLKSRWDSHIVSTMVLLQPETDLKYLSEKINKLTADKAKLFPGHQ
ncbi:MAG: hypothetical protein R6W76_12045, partial [Caldilinea sp.]